MVIKDFLHHMQQANRLHELCNQEGDYLEKDIFAAVNSVSGSLKDLFHDSKGSSRLIVVRNYKKNWCLTQNLFESVRIQGGQCQDDDDRKRLANNLASFRGGVIALDALAQQDDAGQEKEKKYLESGFDLGDNAERELLAAAKTIEDTANSLLAAKSKIEPKKEGDAPDVAEAILEAAMVITSASSTLVGAATLAQRERVEKGRTSNGGPMYRKYPTWAEGVISAATSQLFSASKSYINSQSQHKLTNSTNLLVTAAKVASKEEIDFDELSATGLKLNKWNNKWQFLDYKKN
ncbi:hypothetical protein DICPUDRAFT_158187 [Dictyostelium purpureum]|uniref:I/LWEQ domain-containing protein n=1 Tax=Dictyostelium purpureum TaxID=5786 RepID=F1A113_DICPU|nr:uncharacterized protein DICPUDRAFT_158187 [Dictyostelium purpureum]EGC30122.1 hypothetical protein DICPUDRAFT_158187 [Dictyostelium purpureum]|eukprot:XP_003293354.1 hypothetical protein DICPUDRAFT_158187 [Dictyostelium purpureum]